MDIKGPNLVKGIHLEGLRVLGAPEAFAKYYYENGIDELIYQDVVASLYQRNSLREIISRTAKSIFVPLAVGGGIRTLNDINDVLRAGADKVCINTAAIQNPDFIRLAARRFGSSTIQVAIEAHKEREGRFLAYTDNGREWTGVEVGEWAERAAELGAGEICITSIDREGTGEGFDLELCQLVASRVSIPVIAHGGCGSAEHAVSAFERTGVSAIAIASVLHYESMERNAAGFVAPEEGNTRFLESGVRFDKVRPLTIQSIKKALAGSNIACRL